MNWRDDVPRERIDPKPADEALNAPSAKTRIPKEEKTKPDKAKDSSADAQGGDARSIAEQVADMALSHYQLFQTATGEAFAVSLKGPNVAIWLEGGRSSLSRTLSRLYHELTGKIANSNAITDAMSLLQGYAMQAETREVFVRVARHEENIVVDLGDKSGRCVVLSTTGWAIAERSPVTFCRSELTAPLPTPERVGDIEELRSVLNVSEQSFPLVVGWLVAAFFPDDAHPIALLGGQQGVGKSKAASFLIALADPSSAPLKVQPRDVEQWALMARHSWVLCIDNVSTISDWWSDALCRAVTGDGLVRRKLYSNNDVSVMSFRRVILMTSIDAGALRGDLGERLVLIELEPIPETSRRSESELDAAFTTMRPRIFGAILNLVCAVLQKLPAVKLASLPRMANFALILAALDDLDALDGSAFETYLGQASSIAEDVIESDLLAVAVRELARRSEVPWSGTATELHQTLTPDHPPKGWPANGKGLSGRLRRVAPALEKVGIAVSFDKANDANRTRIITISRREVASIASIASDNAPPSDDWGEV